MKTLFERIPRDLVLALAFTVAAGATRLPGLGFPTKEYFDEVYHAVSARQYLDGEAPAEWVHPPLAKWLIAAGVAAFGYEPSAWRLASAVTGTLFAPLFFVLARHILPTRRAAIFATVLLLSDGVYLVQSRIAMTNIFAVFFQLAAVLFAVRAARGERMAYGSLFASGLFFALALSTRWTTLFAALMIAVVLVGLRGRRIFAPRELLATFVAFVGLPPLVYVASYLPIVTLRPGLQPWHHLRELWDLQVEVWNYHAHLQAKHPYFSRWYTWPFLYRPTWYFFESVEGWVRGIIAIGNPFVWWASLPVTAWALVTGTLARDRVRLFAGLGFCCLYLPWGISPRTLNYGHYLFEAIPYACVALGLVLDRLWDEGVMAVLARLYVGMVIAWFLLFSPLLMGWPVSADFFSAGIWSWFPSWI